MRSRLLALVAFLTLVPATGAGAAELRELLEESREASYTAEQTIICSTPDGIRDAVVRIAQSGGEIRVASAVGEDVEVKAGDGGWVLSNQGGVVSSASVQVEETPVEPLYVVEDLGESEVLGREAAMYRLVRDGVTRAELIIDEETGAMVATTTFTEAGQTYCQRRFVSFDPSDPGDQVEPSETPEQLDVSPWADASLPQTVAGFERLDVYEDQFGFRFAYYSDGFFSFAVFETPSTVTLRDAASVEIDDSSYRRSFTAGQATYVWEARKGGMALVGDLPPDLHEEVLRALPESEDPGFFRRIWRSLFG